MTSYLKYIARATHFKGYAIHSPFLFNLVSDVTANKHPFYTFRQAKQQSRLRFYKQTSGIKWKSYKGLFRLLNGINPCRCYVLGADHQDLSMFQQLGKPFLTTDVIPPMQQNDVLFISTNVSSLHLDKKQSLPTVVVKQPEGKNKGIWKEICGNSQVCTLQFYGFGVAFSRPELPKRSYRIIY